MHYSIVGSGQILDIALNIAVEALQCSVQGSAVVKYSIQCVKDCSPVGREWTLVGSVLVAQDCKGRPNIARGSASWQDGVNFHKYEKRVCHI